MTNPLQPGTVQLVADTENVQSGDVIFQVSWLRDHDNWRGRLETTESYVDHRCIPGCAFPIQTQVGGDRTTMDWPVRWQADRVQPNTAIEIYAVIRAEYRFIKDNGWTKVASKRASQGIDSLFRKGSGDRLKYAVVESKCTRNTAHYEHWVSGGSPLGLLGTPEGEPTDAGQVMSANGVRQMSRPWITHAFLQESRGNSNPAVQEHLRVLRQWMCERRRMPQLW